MRDDKSGTKCPRCGVGSLRGWKDLNEEERIIARRLPGSSRYGREEREASHRWCTNCGYEEAQARPVDA